MSESWRYRYMWDSPDGHEIEDLAGDPDTIIERGRDITSLGDKMKKAASTLLLIADGQVGQGESLKSVKDQADDVHADLKKAGERYAPSGAAITYYGRRLNYLQPLINGASGKAHDAWERVQTAASGLDDADDVPDDADGGSTARDTAAGTAQGQLDTALDEWRGHARTFDTYYSSWESAYEYARDELEQANDDGVEDGFWDNALPFLEALVTVLEWAGVILFIAALVLGGALIGVIAAVVAVIALIGTVILAAKGRKDGKDIAFAALGVIPFGKLGKLAKLGDLAADGARFSKLSGLRTFLSGGDDLVSMRRHMSAIDDLARAAWSSKIVPGMRNFDQITSGSRLFQRIAVGAPYLKNNFPRFLSSREMFVARFIGFGDSLTGMTNGQAALHLLQFNATSAGLADFAGQKIDQRASDARVDSWPSLSSTR